VKIEADSNDIEIVPFDRPSDDYHSSEVIDPVVEVKPEDLQEMKQEPSDENDNVDSHCYVKQEPTDEYCIVGPCFTIQVSSFMCMFHLFLHVMKLLKYKSTTGHELSTLLHRFFVFTQQVAALFMAAILNV